RGNDTCGTCFVLAEEDPNVFLNATIDNRDDADFYCFDAVDNTSIPGFGEHIRVMLEDIPNGADFDLFLYRSVADCNANRPAASSTNTGSDDESIDWVEAINVEDGGRWVVRVKRYQGSDCARQYRLTINGLR
ncbi:MAG: hypothetical protein KC583_18730, partial [Myxococcales bacterium]|nr:hypothetical protein [Myxococcales bacterium]